MSKEYYPSIDWDAQWKAHGYNFQEGHVVIDLTNFGCQAPFPNPIKLKPGPGFGDLSHPTTHLVLQMMAPHVKDHSILDIGCGSGILSIASLAMGAHEVQGIDIEPEALLHSQHNATLNKMQKKAHFNLPSSYSPPQSRESIVVLMNMIASEQKVAWESVRVMHHLPGVALISGILEKDKSSYLAQAQGWGWQLLEERELEGWVGLYFLRQGIL